MNIERSPLLNLDKPTVIGVLKSTGSRDPDILHTQKGNLRSLARFPKLVGTYLMILGFLMTLLIVTSFIGVPLMVFGWWVRRRGVRNLETVESAFSEYVEAAAA